MYKNSNINTVVVGVVVVVVVVVVVFVAIMVPVVHVVNIVILVRIGTVIVIISNHICDSKCKRNSKCLMAILILIVMVTGNNST